MNSNIDLYYNDIPLNDKDYIILTSNYIVNNKNAGSSFLQLYVSSLVIITRDDLGSFTFEEFENNAFMFNDYEFDLCNSKLVIKLNDKISIKYINSDYTLKEIYNVYKDIYINKLLE